MNAVLKVLSYTFAAFGGICLISGIAVLSGVEA